MTTKQRPLYKTYTLHERATIRRLLKEGKTMREIANSLGTSAHNLKATVYRYKLHKGLNPLRNRHLADRLVSMAFFKGNPNTPPPLKLKLLNEREKYRQWRKKQVEKRTRQKKCTHCGDIIKPNAPGNKDATLCAYCRNNKSLLGTR